MPVCEGYTAYSVSEGGGIRYEFQTDELRNGEDFIPVGNDITNNALAFDHDTFILTLSSSNLYVQDGESFSSNLITIDLCVGWWVECVQFDIHYEPAICDTTSLSWKNNAVKDNLTNDNPSNGNPKYFVLIITADSTA